jgi:ribosome-binding factor A
MKSDRLIKVNELIQHSLAARLGEIWDIEGAVATITAVETSPDLMHAVVWVSLLGEVPEESLEPVFAELRAVMGGLKLKFTPKLEFQIDHSGEYAEKIERLLRKI